MSELDPNEILPPPIVVPVVPRSQAGAVQRLLSSIGLTIGFVLQALVVALPQIVAAYPSLKWLPLVIVAASSVWASWQKVSEVGTVVAVPVHPEDRPYIVPK